MPRAEYVRFPDTRCIRATSAAIRCIIDGEWYWIPLSQIHDSSEVWREGDEGMLVISEWIAMKKGLV